MSHIRVFSAEPYAPVISYDVLTKDGIRGETDLGISGPYDDGKFRYSGAIGAGNNPIDGLREDLAKNCHAYPRFTDQDFITDGMRTIDMSQYLESDAVQTEPQAIARGRQVCQMGDDARATRKGSKWWVTEKGIGVWINASDGQPSDKPVPPETPCIVMSQD